MTVVKGMMEYYPGMSNNHALIFKKISIQIKNRVRLCRSSLGGVLLEYVTPADYIWIGKSK